MYKTCKIIVLLILISFPFSTKAHVQHYENLNRIEFDIYRNKSHIGKHIFSFKKSDGLLKVESEINFEIKKFGIVLYKYHVYGTEIYHIIGTHQGAIATRNRRFHLPHR